ncbi:T9SS type A sorting domain-containing protein [Hymenobacter cheonanensis]|uniref:T9SS type A sorting domain-containing protein n=1 Tax=Hymenobacter sp. CA2-7 TaxID=3063993 RepID=UPI0027132702|nr:T9SS type A sorting domain-containing protein [Hymenobacter sp. CA2-7]MDO7886060.1 T9SS type A sorting domain-containing protein [Hymenobacter sp. CA2-7]
MMQRATLMRFRRVFVLLGLASLPSAAAWAQCTTCSTTLDAKTNNYTAKRGEVVCIPAGVTFTGTINVPQDGVTICNSGTITGTISVNPGTVGTVINNVGAISTNNIRLDAATVINNGSSDGGTTVVAGASWGGYLGGTITAALTITNYAGWQAQLQPLPGGTINNRSGATWSGYLTVGADLAITNAGTWTSQVQEGSNSPTISIIQNGGTWSGYVGGGSGSLRITNNASWTQGFNFPSGANNAFTTARGATTTLNGYLGMGGTVALTNSGTMNVPNGMAAVGSTSSLTNAAGSTFAVTGDFTNQGTLSNLGTLTSSSNFTNSGTITGGGAAQRGNFRSAGYTVNNGNFGADGSYLDFCDSTPPTPASNGFDSRGGTVGTNVTFCAAAQSTTPLPVVLTHFSAQQRGAVVLVQWATASEVNSKEFVVERSADGRQFEALQTVASRGTPAAASTYTATDAQPLAGLSYYRLRQVDQDGTRRYSPVANVSRAVAFGAYPNPTPDALTLDLNTLPPGPCAVRLLSLPGQVLLSQALAGGQTQLLSLAPLPAGTYLLEVTSAAQSRSVQRVVKR